MQLLARLMDHVLAARGERTHHRGRDLRRHRRRRGRGVPRPRPGRPRSCCSRNGRISDVQRRMMTTVGAANVHAVAIDGTFDDCQAIVKGMFNHHAFRDRVRAVRRQLDQLGAHRGAGRLLLHRRRVARRAAPQGRLHGADREFRRHLRRLRRRSAWACRSTGWSSPPTSTTFSPARSRPAPTNCATWCRPPRRRWTSRSRRISSGCCSTPMAATAARCAA